MSNSYSKQIGGSTSTEEPLNVADISRLAQIAMQLSHLLADCAQTVSLENPGSVGVFYYRTMSS